MDEREMIQELENLLELPHPSVKGGDRLCDLPQWDSMAVVGFIAMADAKLGIEVSATKLLAAKTVQDLLDIMKARE